MSALFAEEGGVVLNTVYVLAVLAGAGGVIAFLYRQLITSKDALIEAKEKAHQLALAEIATQRAAEEALRKSYQDIAAEALKSATETANYYRAKEGKAPIIPLAGVIPESHSPATPAQQEAARIATMRAAMAQVKLATGQSPRQEGDSIGAVSASSPPGAVDTIKAIEALEVAVEEVPGKVVDRIRGQD